MALGKVNTKSKKVSKGKSKKEIKKKRPDKIADEDLLKKKPSKIELKNLIASLKKDDNNLLLTIRKALRYTRFYLKSEGLTNKLLKEVIRHWSEASEKVRVVCLLIVVRIYTKLQDKERRKDVAKKLYNSFVEKCRITKLETMSTIAFMRHSIIEIYKLDPQIAFQQAQSACNQMSSTLKNATNHKNEESFKTVLNWQYANCAILFSDLLVSFPQDPAVKKLTNQIIEINLGALNLIISPRYYAFYLHIIENLVNISHATGLFIPILSIIVDLLTRIKQPREKKRKDTDSNSDDEHTSSEDEADELKEENDKPTKNSKSDSKGKSRVNGKVEYNLDLLNHVSLDEAQNQQYLDAVIKKLGELLNKYLDNNCHKISFPELTLIARIHLKKWIKSNFRISHPIKSICQKMDEDVAKVEKKRNEVDFAFDNLTAVDAWERNNR